MSPIDLDVVGLLLGTDHRVRSDADLVFYNQGSSADGAVVHAAKSLGDTNGTDDLVIDLDVLQEDVDCVAVAASIDSGSFGDLSSSRLSIVDTDGAVLYSYEMTGLTTERALLLAEIYRRSGAWKIRAVGQGWESGLAGLATDFGINIDEAPDSDGSDGEPVDADIEVTEEPGEPEGVPAAQESVPPPQVVPAPPRRVQVKAKPAKKILPPHSVLGLDPSWQSSRLFSIAGIGGADEQEKRATSALMWTLGAIKPLARSLTARAGAPVGATETFLEVPFTIGDRKVIPDAAIRIARGQKSWTALVEVKTGAGVLRREQLEAYLQVANRKGFDAVITISNDVATDAGTHPVDIPAKVTKKVQLIHISWSEIMHELRMLLSHHSFPDQMQVWVAAELLRYLEHPRSGALAFHDMGPGWVEVRDEVVAGTLTPADKKAGQVMDSWFKLTRQLGLGLTARLGVPVKQVLPRSHVSDILLRRGENLEQLATDGVLSATYKVPGAAGPIHLVADLRTNTVRTSVDVAAPQEGTPARRVGWLTKQLKEAPDKAVVESHFTPRPDVCREKLSTVRENSSVLLPEKDLEPHHFKVVVSAPLGSKRSGAKGSFTESVSSALDDFYIAVVETVRPWVPPAPQLDPEDDLPLAE
ncbi:TerD family protein [Nakamurella sp. YIM 132087]|uniref:TerD family protein n=1 Tax=Nakamurella alba TaxID=2665158 RepID=A0A7K1FSK9_9ACTN|nr:TerD family protein [Nakamurella alba]MTD16163.1 TerD family protein [Nakamurella alba]